MFSWSKRGGEPPATRSAPSDYQQRQHHHNSQHVLAILSPETNPANQDQVIATMLEVFQKTSSLPCAVWRGQDPNTVLLASNYPNCILEGHHFVVLCAGFAYHYQTAFCHNNNNNNNNKNATRASFAQTILDYCETEFGDNDNDDKVLAANMGNCLKQVSGHFSVYLVRKDRNQFWAWNDPFGFMPVYYPESSSSSSTAVVSSHWDCLVPSKRKDSNDNYSLELDWDVVAEYLTLGTTLGGGNGDTTLVKSIRNLSPGSCLHLRTNDSKALQYDVNRYIQCYGACEELLSRRKGGQDDTARTGPLTLKQQLTPPPPRKTIFGKQPSSLRGLCLAENTSSTLPTESSFALDDTLWQEIFHAISSCVQESLSQGVVSRAALTGGGDTRLILACILLQQQQSQLIFQTHAKQKTDWQIAQHLAYTFQLPHERIQTTSTTVEGYNSTRSLFSWIMMSGGEEQMLSNLHDQTPLRRRQRKKEDKYKEDTLAYTLHGRFGTEFLGCLCFDKSPLDIRTRDELEAFRPRATHLLEIIFDSSDNEANIRSPIDTLQDQFHSLKQDKEILDKRFSESAENLQRPDSFDVSFALQLQFFTRANLSDIYKGLRGGSWFSIPAAQFTRNAITPFLDNHLLRLLLCCVPVSDKEEPYQLYGRLYQAMVPDELLKVPSNNKLLCLHTEIPRAIKVPEATARPFQPKFIRSNTGMAMTFESKFNPVFWKGATALFATAPVKMDPKVVANDKRPEVQELVMLVGAEDACLISGRLQSFLLWYERRVLPKIK